MNRPPLAEHFTVEGCTLQRHVMPFKGKPYLHRCSQESFEKIAHAIEERHERHFTGEQIAQSEHLPLSQTYTALAFLREQGLINSTVGCWNCATTTNLYLDAMTEFSALAEKENQ